MNTEEALEYCREHGLTIHWVPIGGKNTAHINTPLWFMENKNLSFVELVSRVKQRMEKEAQ